MLPTPAGMTVLQPSLPPLVVLDVAVAPALAGLGEAEIELLHVGVALELVRRPLQDDAAVLHDVAVVGDAQGEARVLLDDQDRRVELPVEPLDDLEDPCHEE